MSKEFTQAIMEVRSDQEIPKHETAQSGHALDVSAGSSRWDAAFVEDEDDPMVEWNFDADLSSEPKEASCLVLSPVALEGGHEGSPASPLSMSYGFVRDSFASATDLFDRAEEASQGDAGCREMAVARESSYITHSF
ncbi:unnamed protein product [Symbiodinium natans]|uniref:Uncharacterized protein n=1 Tax=Symbiodinium natans TaxID=878477 RepID=A0A812PAL3_9DINO|nr:unnamed protein product [Symbiodinium natans]